MTPFHERLFDQGCFGRLWFGRLCFGSGHFGRKAAAAPTQQRLPRVATVAVMCDSAFRAPAVARSAKVRAMRPRRADRTSPCRTARCLWRCLWRCRWRCRRRAPSWRDLPYRATTASPHRRGARKQPHWLAAANHRGRKPQAAARNQQTNGGPARRERAPVRRARPPRSAPRLCHRRVRCARTRRSVPGRRRRPCRLARTQSRQSRAAVPGARRRPPARWRRAATLARPRGFSDRSANRGPAPRRRAEQGGAARLAQSMRVASVLHSQAGAAPLASGASRGWRNKSSSSWSIGMPPHSFPNEFLIERGVCGVHVGAGPAPRHGVITLTGARRPVPPFGGRMSRWPGGSACDFDLHRSAESALGSVRRCLQE